MDYVTVRELREKSGEVWQRIEGGEEIVVTRNGKPFALLLATQPSEVEEMLRAHRAARFGAVVKRMQAQARHSGVAQLSEEQIQAEIGAVRRARRPRVPGAKNRTRKLAAAADHAGGR
jgi:antitoxin (DNA-binding transcriptional repressor) of toxin-antitoxin stability system